MSRGKYAARAANRRAELEAEANVTGLASKIEELTTENARLRERLVEKDRAHSAETKRLKQQIRDGASPALEVVEREAAKLRADLAEERSHNERRTAQVNKAFERIVHHFAEGHGQTVIEAMESTLPIIGALVDGAEEAIAADLPISLRSGSVGIKSSDALRLIQRARGERR